MALGLASRRNSPRELGHDSPAGAQLLSRQLEIQGADTALPAGDRDLMYSVIIPARPFEGYRERSPRIEQLFPNTSFGRGYAFSSPFAGVVPPFRFMILSKALKSARARRSAK